MRVNSAFTGFFANRSALRPGIIILVSAVFFIASAFTEHSGRELRAKQVNLIIRQFGHQLLLQAGDSTSRVLPVTEIKEGRFLLKFENEFVFDHDSLSVLSQRLLPKTQFPAGYTLTVNDCSKGEIVYGLQVSNTSPDILACKGRTQPAGCYTIEFDFPDFYGNIKQKTAGIDQVAESFKVDPEEVAPKPEVSKTTIFNGIDQQHVALKSGKAGVPEVSTTPEEFNTTTLGYPVMNLVYGGIAVLLGVTLLVGRFGKILKPVPALHQENAATEGPLPVLAALGKFLFNVKDQSLLLGTEVISLTDKEYKVLELLHKNFGELIPRDTLMQEVWINEGVITGRSLDMFISKLRKKLSVDPDLRITNIHGKGYRLETVNDAIG